MTGGVPCPGTGSRHEAKAFRAAPRPARARRASCSLAGRLAAVLAPPRPALADGRIDGEPPRRGVALVSWSGGTVDAVAHAVAAGGGCALGSVRANGPSGGLVGYAFGAPPAANRAFLDRYAAGDLPAGTPLLLVCAEPPVPGALRYNRRDTTGGATTAGSYAFLEDASDLTSGFSIGNAWVQGYAEGLLVHRTDAGGVSRSGFYGDVEAGDAFTVWYAEGCWGHYEVTDVLADPPVAAPRKRFAIEGVTYEYNACLDATGEFRVGVGADIEFRWGPPPPLRVGSDGIPYMRGGQPVEGGRTYRLSSTLVIDVPEGMRLIYRYATLNSDGTNSVSLKDEESGSLLSLDAWSGAERGRRIIASGASRDVGALFDAITIVVRP